MSVVPEPGEVSNTQPERLPSRRRVHLVRTVAFVAVFILFSYSVHAQKRREAILRLRDDVSTAMAHSSLTEKQTQKLDHCRQTLLLAAQSGRRRRAVSKRELDGAVRDIERALFNSSFQSGDRDLVRQDIDQLRTVERNQRARRVGRPYKFQAER